MKFGSIAPALLFVVIMNGCSAAPEPFENESTQELSSPIMLLTSEGYLSVADSVQIASDGSIILDHGPHQRQLNGKPETYKKVARLLSPLRSYSGTEGTPGKWGKTISCDEQSDEKTVVNILWEGSAILEFNFSPNQDQSEFRFGCESRKSNAAKKFIRTALNIIEMEIEGIEKLSNGP